MKLAFSLELPTDVQMVPVARHLCRNALEELGTSRLCISEISLAITEACANVIEHAVPDDHFEVIFEVGESACTIRVIDHGKGFEVPTTFEDSSFDLYAERGRGMHLMRKLVDDVTFDSEPGVGTVVTLTKRLTLEPDAKFKHFFTAAS